MKRIRLLMFLLSLIVGGGSVWAQTLTASEVGAGDFVLYNVGTSQYFTKGNGYGTQASITTNGNPSSAMTLTLSEIDGNYKLGNGNYGIEYLSGGTIYTDQSRNKNSTWTFTQVGTDNGPVYNIISAANHGGGSNVYMTAGVDGTIVTPGTDGSIAGAKWKLFAAAKVPLLTKIAEYEEVRATVMGFATNTSAYTDEVGAANTLTSTVATQDEAVNNATTTTEIDNAMSAIKAAGNTFLESVIITAGFDITNAWITNPSPGIAGNLTGWTNSGAPSLQYQLYEYWNVSGATTKQTLYNLPKGAYKLSAIAYTRDNMTAYLNAGEDKVKLVGCGSVNDRNGGNNWIAQGHGLNELNFTLDEATESLEIGLTADNSTVDHWMCWRSFTLIYYGDPINLKKAQLVEAVAAAQAIDGNTIPTAAKDAIDEVVTANNQTWSTEAEYDDAVSAINTAISTYASAGIVAAYATVTEAKAIYNQTDYTDKDGAKATFKSLIDAADATTNLTDLNAAIVNLKAGLVPFISTVTLDQDAFFNVTNFFVVNPSVSQNTTGWTIEGTPNGDYSFGVCNYGECEFYQQNFKFYQTLALTPGTWEFGVTGFHRAGNHSTYFYAGEDKILIPGVESTVVNTMAQAKTYFDNGNGKVALKFLIEETQDVEIGINNQDDDKTDKWTIFRDFTLKYYGAPDYSVYDEQWAALVSDAATAKTTYPNVIGSELTALNEAIADEPDGSSKANYIEKISALQSALMTFTGSAASWNNYVAVKAQVSGELPYANPEKKTALDNAVAATVNSATEADAQVAAINTANRLYVESNALAEGVEDAVDMTDKIKQDALTDWTEEITGSDAHFVLKSDDDTYTAGDGTKGTNLIDTGDLWGASSYTAKMSQDVTLTAGRYLLTATARGSNDLTTFRLFADDESVNMGHFGAAVGTGIFDRGFNDYSVEFELTEAKSVNIGFEAATESAHNWASVARFRLVQLEETDVWADASDIMAFNEATQPTAMLGFEDGEYAPYNNIDNIATAQTEVNKVLAEMEAFGGKAKKATVTAATAAINALKWVANDGEVNAVYDGDFAIQTVPAENTRPLGWSRHSATANSNDGTDSGYETRLMTLPEGASASGKGMMTKFHTFYGDTEGYELPLKANTAYQLTFKYAGWGNSPTMHINVYAENGTKIATSDDFTAKTGGDGSAEPYTEYAYMFTTEAAGNYVIGLIKNAGGTKQNQAVFTDIELKKVADLTIDEEVGYTGSKKYYNVTLQRKVKKGVWNSFTVPFNMNKPDGWTVKKLTASEINGNQDVRLTFSDAEAIEAGVPYMVKLADDAEKDVNEISATGVAVDPTLHNITTTNADMTGNMEPMAAPVGSIIISNNMFLSVVEGKQPNMKAFRAYITLHNVSGEARIIAVGLDDETTGINGVNAAEKKFDGAVYDLSGRKVAQPTRGLYIVNGKKVVIK